MRKSNVLWVMVALCFLIMSGPASATWEFSMTGNFYYQWYWGGQIGDEGFFGRFDRPDTAALGLGAGTNLNFWAGGNDLGNSTAILRPGAVTDIKTGHDAMVQTQWMDVDPEIRINQAVRIRGRYHIGSYGFVFDSENPNSFRTGMQQAFSEGQWYLLWLTAQTPFGIITIGKRPDVFGIGGRADGTWSRVSESFSLVAESGPIRYIFGFHPWRNSFAYLGDIRDNSGLRNPDATVGLTYRTGPLDMGARVRYVFGHQGVEGSSLILVGGRDTARTLDQPDNEMIAYLKYFNGRFFFNAEGSYFYRYQYRQQSMVDTPAGPATIGFGVATQPQYREEWRGLVELGTVAGPAKVTGMWWWNGHGLDRRAGVVIDKQGLLQAAGATLASGTEATVVFLPFSWLLAHQYGGGNNGFSAVNADGGLYDATAYAARVDYAVAANLNTWVSFLWADRVSKSYPWGFVFPAFGAATGTPTGVVAYSLTPAGAAALGATAVPSIPDSNLGYEVDAGFDWRLLEGFRVEGLIAYWKPGKWFSYACRDIGNAAWKAPNAAFNWGVSPQRNIDPVVGGYLSLVGEF